MTKTIEPTKNSDGELIHMRGALGGAMRQMTREEASFLVAMMMEETGPCPLSEELKSAFNSDPGCLIIKNRLEAHTADVAPRVIIMCACMCERQRIQDSEKEFVPGMAVMWAFMLYVMWSEGGGSTLRLQDWAYYFPDGVPTESAMQEAWDYQKGHVHGLKEDNLLDTRHWSSFDTRQGDGPGWVSHGEMRRGI